jgi:two-component system CheB/CheR fusion protein
MAATPEDDTPTRPALNPPAEEQAGASDQLFAVVGIGASAGGLEALTEFFQALDPNSGLAFVVVSHLDPERKSALGDILARSSRLPVGEVAEGIAVVPNHVYVMPASKEVTITDGVLHLAARPEPRAPHMPVDIFLRSLAADCKSQAIGVVLSGTGSDGTLGLKAIKEEGGLTFAQDQTAGFGEMPGSAIAAGCVDAALRPAQIAAELLRISRRLAPPPPEESPVPADPGEADAFKQIIHLLSKTTGVDFIHYKQSTLRRRINRRLVLHHIQSLADYLEYLRKDASERNRLFDDVLITVTHFFRDPEVFEALKTTVLPRLIANRMPEQAIRVWVPGCASGEEAYSIAICLLEHLETTGSTVPIKIFATDISDHVIETARAGVYSEAIVSEVSPQRLQRFFVRTRRGYEISKVVRDLCTFGRQDLTRDPPFSQLDLISCRNVLIYLDPVLQGRVLPLFHFALKPGGCLLLGRAETVGSFTDLFEPLDRWHRLYVSTAIPSRLSFAWSPTTTTRQIPAVEEGPQERARNLRDLYYEADRVVLAQYAPPGVLVDEKLKVIQFRGDTGPFLKPPSGPPSTDLLLMAREGLVADLRAVLDRASQSNVPIRKGGVRVRANQQLLEISLEVIPITDFSSGLRYFVVLFKAPLPSTAPAAADTGRSLTTQAQREKDVEIIGLRQELEATRAYLQSVIELKDVGNEELRAANEEISSSNEELQSTNDELSSSKEELQAANEELSAVNDELQNRIHFANELSDDLVNLIETTNIPIVVFGTDLCIRRITPGAQRVLDLSPSDLGRPVGFLNLKINLPDLKELVKEVVDTLEVCTREVVDESGAWHRLSIRPYRTQDHAIAGVVLMLIDIDPLKRRERQLQESRDYAVSIVEAIRHPLVVLDDQLCIQSANRAFYHTFQIEPRQTEGRPLYELGNGQWNIAGLRTFLEQGGLQEDRFEDFEVEHDFPRIGQRKLLLNAQRIAGDNGEPNPLILLAVEDVTTRRQAESGARHLAAIVEYSSDAIISQSLDGAIVSWNEGATHIFGYSARETIGRPVLLLVPPDRAEELHQVHERIRHGERILPFRTRRLRKDGKEITVAVTYSPIKDSAGRIVGISAIKRDVTEQEGVESALEAGEARLRAFVETAVDAIVTIDEGGLIESVNPATEKMFGYSASELIGHNVKMLMPPPYRNEHDGYLARYLQIGEKRIIGIGREVQARRKDGLTFPVDLAVSEFHVQGRRKFTGAIRDISARKQLEREVLEVATLEQRRIGQALHDSTGQELTALGLLAETLTESLTQQASSAAPLAVKVREGLKRVLAQVRGYSRGLIPVDVDSRGLRAALSELATRTSEIHGVNCTFDCEGHVDVEDNHTATHLYHIAQEAVTNALRHAQARQIVIRLEGNGKMLTLSVSDDGVGLLPAPSVDSKGMGLKIMHYRAGLIQARLNVESAQPSGTLVTCTLSKGAANDQEQEGPT